MVEMPLTQIDIDRRLVEDTLRGAYRPLRRIDPILFQDLDRALRREMPALLVGRPEFQRRNQLTVAFQLRLGQYAWGATIRPMHRARFQQRLKRSVHRRRGHSIHLGHRRDLRRPFRTFGRQAIQALPELDEGVGWDHVTARAP